MSDETAEKPVISEYGQERASDKKVEVTGQRFGDWVEATDPTTGKRYYANVETRDTSWEPPEEWIAMKKTHDAGQTALSNQPMPNYGPDGEVIPSDTIDEAATKARIAAESNRDQWQECVDPSTGKTYYFHVLTRETRWDNPFEDHADDDENDEETAELLDSVEGCTFTEWAVKKFARKYKGTLFTKTLDPLKLVNYSNELSHSLLRCDPDTNKEGLQNFKNIRSYCEERKSSKDPYEHAIKICDKALRQTDLFRDEVYSQLCKQATNNPKTEGERKIWELISICASIFPPSEPFYKYLVKFCQDRSLETTKGDPYCSEQAKACIQRLKLVHQLGPRMNPPSTKEIECILQQVPHPLTIQLPDMSEVEAFVDSSTTVEELNAMLAESLGLKNPEPFHVFETMSNDYEMSEEAMDVKKRVLDYVADWGSKGEDGTTYSIMYKVRLQLGCDMDEPDEVKFHFLQAVADIASGKYLPSEEDAIALAATAMQGYGETVTREVVIERLPFLVCDMLLAEGDTDTWAERVETAYSRLPDQTPDEACKMYVAYCVEKVPFYPASFFLTQNDKSVEFPRSILVAVHMKGVTFQEADTREIIREFPYSEILTWGHNAGRFLLVYGDMNDPEKLYLATAQAKEMDHLCRHFVGLVVNKLTGGKGSEQPETEREKFMKNARFAGRA